MKENEKTVSKVLHHICLLSLHGINVNRFIFFILSAFYKFFIHKHTCTHIAFNIEPDLLTYFRRLVQKIELSWR